jgi:hypothetical protein
MVTQAVDDPLTATAETVVIVIAARAMETDTEVVLVLAVMVATAAMADTAVVTTATRRRKRPCLRSLQPPPQMPMLPRSIRMLPKHGLHTTPKILTKTPMCRWAVMEHTWRCGSNRRRNSNLSTPSTMARQLSLLPLVPVHHPRRLQSQLPVTVLLRRHLRPQLLPITTARFLPLLACKCQATAMMTHLR